MEKGFKEVAGAALEEAREKFARYWSRGSQDITDAVNLAMGLFAGIALRRMHGDPDPDDPEAAPGEYTPAPGPADQDAALFDWLVSASGHHGAGDFLRSLAEAGLRADSFNYALLRPVLLQMKAKYPKYGL